METVISLITVLPMQRLLRFSLILSVESDVLSVFFIRVDWKVVLVSIVAIEGPETLMSVKQPQTIAVVFAILALFADPASGQRQSADIPVFAAENVIFATSVVTDDVAVSKTAFLQEMGGDFKLPDVDIPDWPGAPTIEAPTIEAPTIEAPPAATDIELPNIKDAKASVPQVPDFQVPEMKDLEDIKKQPSPTSQASYQNNGSSNSMFGGSSQRLVDQNGYFIQAKRGGLWNDVSRPSQSLEQVNYPDVENNRPLTEADLPDAPATTPTDAQYVEQMNRSVLSDAIDGNYQPTAVRTPGLSKFRLRIGFDALLWERGRPDNDVFATDANGREWSFNDFEFTEGTPRYFVQYMGDDLTGFEFTFYDFNTFAGSLLADGTSVIPLFFQASPAQIGNTFTLDYTSRLKNAEFNWWVRLNEGKRRGWGLRHINLDENYNVITGAGGNDGLFSRTNNEMWGVHRMWERRRPFANRLDLVGGIDLGVYLNRTQIDVDTRNVDDSSEGKNLAGTFGFNFGVQYLVANHVTLRFGYEGVALMGVSLASTNSLEQPVLNGLDDPELGGLFIGGFNIGAIAAF